MSRPTRSNNNNNNANNGGNSSGSERPTQQTAVEQQAIADARITSTATTVRSTINTSMGVVIPTGITQIGTTQQVAGMQGTVNRALLGIMPIVVNALAIATAGEVIIRQLMEQPGSKNQQDNHEELKQGVQSVKECRTNLRNC